MSQDVKLKAKFWTSGQYEKIASRIRFGATNAANVSHSRKSRARGGRFAASVAVLTIGGG
jgi:hypothetical protein